MIYISKLVNRLACWKSEEDWKKFNLPLRQDWNVFSMDWFKGNFRGNPHI